MFLSIIVIVKLCTEYYMSTVSSNIILIIPMIYFFYLMNHKYIFCSMQSATSNLNYQINVVEHNIGLQNVVEWQCKVAENGNTQAKYLKIVFKCRS